MTFPIKVTRQNPRPPFLPSLRRKINESDDKTRREYLAAAVVVVEAIISSVHLWPRRKWLVGCVGISQTDRPVQNPCINIYTSRTAPKLCTVLWGAASRCRATSSSSLACCPWHRWRLALTCGSTQSGCGNRKSERKGLRLMFTKWSFVIVVINSVVDPMRLIRVRFLD